jgi:hypothetical protein
MAKGVFTFTPRIRLKWQCDARKQSPSNFVYTHVTLFSASFHRLSKRRRMESKSSEEREIGAMAVWSLSTAKPGNGVEQLRDDNIETYWQCVPGHPCLSSARTLTCRTPAGPMGRSHI